MKQFSEKYLSTLFQINVWSMASVLEMQTILRFLCLHRYPHLLRFQMFFDGIFTIYQNAEHGSSSKKSHKHGGKTFLSEIITFERHCTKKLSHLAISKKLKVPFLRNPSIFTKNPNFEHFEKS